MGLPVSVSAILTSNIRGPVEVGTVTHTFGDKAEVSINTIEPGRKYKVTLTANARARAKWRGRVVCEIRGAPIPRVSLPAFIEVAD